MEIADYLRVARRRLWVLILVPLLAAAAAVATVLQTPIQYSATATLSSTAFVGGTSNQFTGPQAAGQFAAAFTASATGPAVLAAASQESHVPVSELQDGLTVTQNGASSDMTLTFSGPDPKVVVPALRSIESETLNSMFGLQVDLAKSQVDDADAAVVAANQALTQATLKYGTRDPVTKYRAQLRHVAVSNLTSAQGAYQMAKSQLVAAQAENILYVSGVHSVSRRASLISTVIPVVGAAIFLAVILVMMLELLAHNRRSSRQRSRQRQAETRSRGADHYQPAGGLAENVVPGE